MFLLKKNLLDSLKMYLDFCPRPCERDGILQLKTYLMLTPYSSGWISDFRDDVNWCGQRFSTGCGDLERRCDNVSGQC